MIGTDNLTDRTSTTFTDERLSTAATNLSSCQFPTDLEIYEPPAFIEAEVGWVCDPILPDAKPCISVKYPWVIERKRAFCELVIARARGPPEKIMVAVHG